MNLFKMLIIILCCFSATALSAQKQLVKKANTFYKNNKYKDAIELYEQILKDDDNLSSSTKLAYCYRMTNQMAKAEEWYTKVVANDKAKPITYFYYAESLMNNGKYDLAKNWFLKYNEKKPDDKNAMRMAYACDKIKVLQPYFQDVNAEVFEHNSEADESSPLYFNEGIVFTSDRPSGANPLKQKSGWTGRDYQRIYFSSAKSDGSYESPINFSKKLNDLNKHCGPVSFTKDKKTVIFTRTGQDLGKNNSYNIQLFSAESDDGEKWKNVALLPFCNKEHNYMHPAISPDGTKLFFISDKPGGLGGTDVYLSEKKADGWGKPQNLGPIINTSANEAFPFFHESEKLFFCSKGHLSYGGFDILFSNLKEDGSWQKPVNVGKPINSSYDDISISLDESMESGLFSSARNGGDDDIYIFKVLGGINEDLESLDFEGIVENNRVREEKKEENKETEMLTPVATENQEVTTEIVTSNPIDRSNDENQPVKNTQETINENETIKVVPVEQQNEEVAAPKFLEADKEEQAISDYVSQMASEEIVDNVELDSREPAIQAVPKEEVLPDRKVKIMDAKPVEKALTTAPIVKEEPRMIEEETLAVKRKKSTKRINLMIPAKKKEQHKSDNETLIFDEAVLEIKELSETEREQKEALIMSRKASILDTEVIEKKDPVLIGDESSPLSREVLELPSLAELLQTNQEIPQTGFIVTGLDYPQGSYLLSSEGTRSLTAIIDLMTLYPTLEIEIGSHTSARGSDVANHNLSRKRAKSIKAFIVYKGVSSDRITTKGYGETQLLNACANGVDCANAEHEENDRIEIKVVQ